MNEIKVIDIIKRQKKEILELNKTIAFLNRKLKKKNDILIKINGIAMREISEE